MGARNNQSNHTGYSIQRRSSAHSAYWLSNALVPAGLVMMYKYGLSFESFLGALFIVVGAIGWVIYKKKMSVPLITRDDSHFVYQPSATAPGSIKMDSSAVFTVRELGLSAERSGVPASRIEVSRLDFNSNADWAMLINHLRREPEITLLFDYLPE